MTSIFSGRQITWKSVNLVNLHQIDAQEIAVLCSHKIVDTVLIKASYFLHTGRVLQTSIRLSTYPIEGFGIKTTELFVEDKGAVLLTELLVS